MAVTADKVREIFKSLEVDRFARRGYNLTFVARNREESGEVTIPDRVDRPPVLATQKPPRILLVNAALSLHDAQLLLLRSIPAIVETVASCADLYRHEERDYALVILALHSKSKETAEAARFVRHRWSAARILLLEGESAAIDDWLYDERVDPRLHPAAVREAAKRLMTKEKYWIQA
ncbi:MAG: hypothetical protein ABSD59_16535 [Terracidiphilus sp.]|jgi:hypothetical protein